MLTGIFCLCSLRLEKDRLAEQNHKLTAELDRLRLALRREHAGSVLIPSLFFLPLCFTAYPAVRQSQSAVGGS